MCPFYPPPLFYTPGVNSACFLLVAAGVALFYSNWLIVNASQHLTWNDIQTVPARNVGLVLGAKPGNRYFTGGLILPPRCITPVK
ncbi:SanA protein [Salmonella enterica subsp. enterica]|uniref:SanA protein n=1 Tax=Salmonella enterica I TaxID=59201 RepID=A0A379WL19_SALET|nr:SanA protein [Salmonella enterica subsp. enterica]